MKLTFSNHYEALEAALLDDLAETPPDPFARQHIVIPSLAIRRRLELGIANRFGICANLNCGYLAQWLWGQIGAFVPVPAVSPFAPNLLVWRVYRLLSGPAFSGSDRLQQYLQKADEVMRFELATRITKLFDHYLTYRPQWLAAWSEGREADIGSSQTSHLQDAAWQGALWRQIVGELGLNPFHPAADFFAAAATVEANDPRLASLPQAAFVFCLPAMPPLYIRLLEQLSRWIDLRLYLLNPCQHYWFEIVDARRLAYLAGRGQDTYHETGNQLLASWGKQTQAQIDLLLGESSAEVTVDDSRFAENERPTLLAALQNAILNLEPLAPLTPDSDDQSIQIHSCHHLTRQLEVLHDQLLALFAGARAPTAADVLVVTPDLNDAAPVIDAVFGTAPVERRIPYTITGRPVSQENTIARILLQLLTLPHSRFAASVVFQLLQEAPIARRFDLQAEEQHSIQGWLRDSGIRWGLDADHRQECGFAHLPRHTFSEGLQRLFLGYALPDGDDQLVWGLLPSTVGEGSKAQALGRFWLLVDTLQSLRQELAHTRRAEEWQQTLLDLVDTFFPPDDDWRDQLKDVRSAIADLCGEMRASVQSPLVSDGDSVQSPLVSDGDQGNAISLAVLQLALHERFDDPARGGVPSGRVTFAAMSSLRGLPYRVICLLGMDDGAFPSASKPIEFDLMAIHPERGDQQRKNDERNLFLDLLLAARERLILTYSGRSIHDNAPLPPSVLISELLDQLLPAIAGHQADAAALGAARARLVIEHPLQAFSARYFRDPPLQNNDCKLFSFDTDFCEAARLGATTQRAVPDRTPTGTEEEIEEVCERQAPFLLTPLAAPDAAWRTVNLQQLLRFFQNPCRYLLGERLGIQLSAAATELSDDEPFALDWEGWRSVSDRLLPLMLDNHDQGHLERLAAAGHEFPDGNPGELLRRRELGRLHDFARLVRSATAGLSPEPVSFSFAFELNGEAWQLTGALTGVVHSPDATECGPASTLQNTPPPPEAQFSPRLTGGGGSVHPSLAGNALGLLRYRCDKTRPADYLSTWISHLALSALLPPGSPASSRCLSLDGEFTFPQVDNAQAILQELLACYRQGLSLPLHFFPKSAWAYMTNGCDLRKAHSRWQCTPQRPHGEAADPYYRLALRGEADPLAGDFATLAHTIYGPLLTHIEDARLKVS